MNYYELVFIGFDGDCYCPETNWLIKTERTYDEMQDYVDTINKVFRSKYPDSKSYFIFDEEEALDGCPSFGKLENDLRDL